MGAAANLANTIIGAGVLSLPIFLKYTGIVPALLILSIIGWMGHVSLMFLRDLATWMPEDRWTFSDLGHMYLGGRFGTILVQSAVIGAGIGVLTAHMVLLGDLALPMANEVFGSDSVIATRMFVTLFLGTLLVLPLSLLPTMAHLKHSSVFSVSIVLVVGIVVFYDAVTDETFEGDVAWFRASPDVFKGIPIAAFAFSCQPSFFPIAAEQKSLDTFHRPVMGAMSLVGTLYAFVALAGYFKFGEATEGNLINGYSSTSYLFNTVRVLLAVTSVLTYPQVNFPTRVALDVALFPDAPRKMTLPRFLGITLSVWVLSIVLALTFPSITVVFGIVGATAAMLNSFIIPGTAYLVAARLDAPPFVTPTSLFLAKFLVVCGTLVGLTSLVVIVVGVVQGDDG